MSRFLFSLFFGLVCGLFVVACSGSMTQSDLDYLITIHTPKGDMKLILYDSTPEHKANFLELVRAKAYDGTIFHRVIKNFVIQGGDVTRKEDNDLPAEATLPAEFFRPYYHRKGALAAARSGDQQNPERRSSAYQFYIVQGSIQDEQTLGIDNQILGQQLSAFISNSAEDSMLVEHFRQISNSGDSNARDSVFLVLVQQMEKKLSISLQKNIPEERIKAYTTLGGIPHLDDAYTVFGQVVEGFEVLDQIAATDTDPSDLPTEDIAMTVEVEEISKSKLRERYALDEHMRLP